MISKEVWIAYSEPYLLNFDLAQKKNKKEKVCIMNYKFISFGLWRTINGGYEATEAANCTSGQWIDEQAKQIYSCKDKTLSSLNYPFFKSLTLPKVSH